MTPLADGEVPGGVGCGDLPLRQLLALHHRQKREEGRVNLGLLEELRVGIRRILDFFDLL